MYLVFAGSCFYPHGGMEDLKLVKDSIDAAKKWFEEYAPKQKYEPDQWCQVVDGYSLEIICKGDYDIDGFIWKAAPFDRDN